MDAVRAGSKRGTLMGPNVLSDRLADNKGSEKT